MSIRSCTNLLRSSISSTSSPLILARRCIASASGSGIASGSGSSTRSQSIIYNSPSSSSPRSPIRNSPSGYGTTRSSRVVSRFFGSTRTIFAEGPSDIAPAPEVNVTELTSGEYEHVSERDMEILYESLENLCEEFGAGEWEVEYSSGVLTLSLSPHGTYVINKQPPNQQIWISSPISGPGRFGYDNSSSQSPASGGQGKATETETETGTQTGTGTWVHNRFPGVTLGKLLDSELREILDKSHLAGAWEGTGLK